MSGRKRHCDIRMEIVFLVINRSNKTSAVAGKQICEVWREPAPSIAVYR